ncbi:orotidine-5'-phosphate decarboxylase [Microbaculum marinum]|uniref:Orotidine 5'-phosphate decarboxylase n=1 Tax=Microbaculum marinum TaxID=1764581 RepID=A0AAW9RUW1_9HYPH
MLDPRDRLIVGLDLPARAAAEELVANLGDAVGIYKIGMQLTFSGGFGLVRDLTDAGKSVFLDMKLLDIPNTVAGAVEAIAATGADFTTIHAYPQAMRAAVSARGDSGLKLLGVTVLTSLDDGDLSEAGYQGDLRDLVLRRAEQAAEIGMDGLICSPKEVAAIRAAVGDALELITPGIRPAGSDAGDQKRAATPSTAIRDGADRVVVARPITRAENPRAVAEAIVEEIGTAA